MYAGAIVESGLTPELLDNPFHPYTQGLLACLPRMNTERGELATIDKPTRITTHGDETRSFLDYCPSPFAPRNNRLPLLREIAPNHLVRCWEDQ